MTKSTIKHDGVVSRITAEGVEVSIAVSSACAGCHAQSACGMVDDKKRIINVASTLRELKIGDVVEIEGAQSLGMSAVFFAYVLPFLFVMLSLIISLFAFEISEVKAGFYALLVLPVYYIALSFFKTRFEKKYIFRIIS